MANENNTTSKSAGRATNGALWASAFVIAGMILAQAGRVGVENEARADVSEVGDLTIATFQITDGSQPVAILSRRAERLFIYGVERANTIELMATEDLRDAFTKARQLGSGGQR